MTRCTHNANYVCPECEQKRAALPSDVEELLPCPFCGGKAQHKNCRGGEDSMLAWIVCVDCGAMTEQFEDAYAPTEQAKSEWNRRASTPTEKGAENGALEQLIDDYGSADTSEGLFLSSLAAALRGLPGPAPAEVVNDLFGEIAILRNALREIISWSDSGAPPKSLTDACKVGEDAFHRIACGTLSRARSASVTDAFNRGAREGWNRCGVFHVDLDFETWPDNQKELDQRWPLETKQPPTPPAHGEGELRDIAKSLDLPKLLREATADEKTIRTLTFERWKDGIEVEHASFVLERLAEIIVREYRALSPSPPQQDGSGLVETDRNRLADILWARGMAHEDLKERSGWLLASTVVRRGRELTDQEKVENIFRAVDEPDEDEALASTPKTTDHAPARAESVTTQTGNATMSEIGNRIHSSDCALHNMPADVPGPCNCGAIIDTRERAASFLDALTPLNAAQRIDALAKALPSTQTEEEA